MQEPLVQAGDEMAMSLTRVASLLEQSDAREDLMEPVKVGLRFRSAVESDAMDPTRWRRRG